MKRYFFYTPTEYRNEERKKGIIERKKYRLRRNCPYLLLFGLNAQAQIETDVQWNEGGGLQVLSEHQLQKDDIINLNLDNPEGNQNLIEDYKTNRFKIISREYSCDLIVEGSYMDLIIYPEL